MKFRFQKSQKVFFDGEKLSARGFFKDEKHQNLSNFDAFRPQEPLGAFKLFFFVKSVWKRFFERDFTDTQKCVPF